MSTISVSKARAQLPSLLERVRAGDEITLTRHGEPVAVLLRPDALRVRRDGASALAAERIREALAAARGAPLPTTAGLTVERAEELAGEIRAGRSAR
ncbi:MAG: type II toxin-antitoxin system Phd/YefM family antitoxin [Solirubrobacteraceae bacterium]